LPGAPAGAWCVAGGCIMAGPVGGRRRRRYDGARHIRCSVCSGPSWGPMWICWSAGGR